MSEFRSIIEAARDAEIASMRRMGLGLEDAEDVFQEASMAFYEQLREQRLQIKSNPEGYLHGICRHLALKRLEELSYRRDYIDEDRLDRLLELTADDEDEALAIGEKPSACDPWDQPENNYGRVLNRVLSELTQRDKSLIRGFYLEGKSMQQLAEELQLATVEVARTTKCRILSRMRERALTLINEYY